MEIGDLFRLSDIKLPEGVVIHELELEDGHDRTIVNMQPPTVEEVDEDAEELMQLTYQPLSKMLTAKLKTRKTANNKQPLCSDLSYAT